MTIGRKILGVTVIAAAALVAMAATPKESVAQVGTEVLSYAVKFTCGTRRFDTKVVHGLYETSVNIHNPHSFTVQFLKKAVVAENQRRLPIAGVISPFVEEVLGPDEARAVDCRDIRNLFPGPIGQFAEGFVVLIVFPIPGAAIFPELDVVGVYTARGRTGTDLADPNKYDVDSIDVEIYDNPKTVLFDPAGALPGAASE